MKLLVSFGSYERIVFGCDIEIKKSKEAYSVVSVKESFAIPAHLASVRSIASCPRFMVSGSTDETIKIFDLKRRKDIGSVCEHNGSISSLQFYESSHLLTGSEDGKVALFRTSDFECLHVFHHKAPVTCAAVHPSGKLAISVAAKDRSLRLWNLVTGKAAGRSKTPRPTERIVWSPSGDTYALLSESAVHVYSTTASQEPRAELESAKKLIAVVLVDDQTLLVAGEGGDLKVFDMASRKTATFDLGQSPRIKDMNLVGDLLVTLASEGSVRVWDVRRVVAGAAEPILQHTVPGLRPICMTTTLL